MADGPGRPGSPVAFPRQPGQVLRRARQAPGAAAVPGECAGVRPASLGLQIALARFWRPAMVRRRKGDFMQETPPPARFKADMPQIPGVGSSPATSVAWSGK